MLGSFVMYFTVSVCVPASPSHSDLSPLMSLISLKKNYLSNRMSQLSQECIPLKKRNYNVNLLPVLSESVHCLLSPSSIHYSDTEGHVKGEKAQNADISKLFSVIVSAAISLIWEIFISPVMLKQNLTTGKQKRKLLYWHFYPCENKV